MRLFILVELVLYRDGLDGLDKQCYHDKITVIYSQDPYEIVLWSTDKSFWPSRKWLESLRDSVRAWLVLAKPAPIYLLQCFVLMLPLRYARVE
ncbi:hypothetical protein MAR_025008, partial [Mya arenaria]